ncbi:hypothetical protein RKD49_000500 [Streptomyces glaucescens]
MPGESGVALAEAWTAVAETSLTLRRVKTVT